MAKYYTEEASTPVFAVTFVSNRKGIVPQEIVEDNTITNNSININPEDIINEKYPYAGGQKEEETRLIERVKYFKEKLLPNIRGDENTKYSSNVLLDRLNEDTEQSPKYRNKSLNDLRQELIEFRQEKLINYSNTSSNSSTKTIPTEDKEYLVYSNVEIKSISDTDLSQQSNWYLRDAEVELTRDWPVCKAKLIVAAKLNDDGSIPTIKQVEEGFIYDQIQQNDDKGKPTNKFDFKAIPGGRFLSADDEVRIYAGYKNETYVTIDDLDQYPFDFKTFKVVDLPEADAKQVRKLEEEKKKIQDAVSKIDNPLFDPNFWITAAGLGLTAAGIALFVAGSAPILIPSAVVASGTGLGTAGAAATSVGVTIAGVGGSSIGATTVFLGYATGTTVVGGAGAAVPVTVLTTIGATSTAAAAGGAAATITGVGATARNINNGSVIVNSNKSLKEAFLIEIASINNLIQTIQRKAGLEPITKYSTKSKLAPIFWGFIDSVDFISNSDAGVQIIYNLRDRSRILADTKLVTLPYLNKDNNERGAFEGLRHKTIEGVYRATNGGIYLDNNYISATSTQWREGFDVGEVITLYDNKINTTGNRTRDQTGKITEDKEILTDDRSKFATSVQDQLAQQRIKYSAAIEDQASWTTANSFLSSNDIKESAISKYDPLFHIWTLQPPVVQGGGQSVMQIVNKSPFEILTYLQVTEVMPIDFFCSHVNGHFLFAPRVLDTTGLNDPERGNRLYFFFQCFDKVPEARNLIKDIRVQTSTIGVYNRFAIANAEFNNPTNASLSDLYTVVDIASANTKNRKVPIKQHIIVDPKIKDQSNKEGYAQGLALTTASIMARDNTTVIFKVIGDSTFYPGEAVRVYNTVLHGKDTFTYNSQTESSATFLRDLYQAVQELKSGTGAVKQQGSQAKVVNLNNVIDKIRKGSGTESNDLNDVLPMYKVRAITHSLKAGGSDAGYTTKIVAIADIL